MRVSIFNLPARETCGTGRSLARGLLLLFERREILPLQSGDVAAVPLGVDERIGRTLTEAREFLRQVIEEAVRAEKDVAGQGLEDLEGARVIVGDGRIARVADELV